MTQLPRIIQESGNSYVFAGSISDTNTRTFFDNTDYHQYSIRMLRPSGSNNMNFELKVNGAWVTYQPVVNGMTPNTENVVCQGMRMTQSAATATTWYISVVEIREVNNSIVT